jgi:pimeloyl-ACP methyl ester carboxylesterase
VLLAALTASLALAAPPMQGPYLQGADIYWLWRVPHPRAVVVFEHGLDQSELAPTNHLPWIEHLAAEGNDVIYPRYENQPGRGPALRHSLIAIHAALLRLGRPDVPLVVVGYSRGGRLAVELSAAAWRIHARPAAVMSIFPSTLNRQVEEIVNLTNLPKGAHVVLLAGGKDSPAGVLELLRRLRDAHFPAAHVQAAVVRGADHFAPLQVSPMVKRQFWDRLDGLIALARRSHG